MKYEEMSDFEVNFLVYCSIEIAKPVGAYKTSGWFDIAVIDCGEHYSHKDIPNYCNNASHAWPIIVDSAISIQPVHKVAAGGYYKLSEIKFWTAWATNRQSIDSFTEDKNPLRAAMICFLKMKDAQQ